LIGLTDKLFIKAAERFSAAFFTTTLHLKRAAILINNQKIFIAG